MRVQLDLARAVKQNVVFSQLFQALFQPLEVVLQLFKCIQHPTVRPQVVVTHDLFKCHKVANVEGARVVRFVVRRVEVHDGALATYCAHELVH